MKKKAILCAARLVNTSPQHAPMFIAPMLPLIYLRTKRMVMPTLVLAIELCKVCPGEISQFQPWTKRLCDILMTLAIKTSTTYQVSGTNHPYMQMRCIRLLSMLENSEKEVILSVIQIGAISLRVFYINSSVFAKK